MYRVVAHRSCGLRKRRRVKWRRIGLGFWFEEGREKGESMLGRGELKIKAFKFEDLRLWLWL